MTKRIVALFMAVLVLLSFTACGENSGGETAETLSTTSYIRENKTIVASVKGLAGIGVSKVGADRDYAYTVSYYDDAEQVKELVRSGKADIASLDIADAVELYKEGTDIKIIAVNNLLSMYIITKGITVREPSDLNGKEIYTLKTDSVTENFAKILLSENGAEYEKLNLRTMSDINELIKEIEGKDKYVLMLTGADSAKLPEDKERDATVDLTFGWINKKESLPVHSVIVARTEYISSNSEIIDEFRMFNEMSVNYIINNAEPAAEYLCEEKFFDSIDAALSFISNYCTLSYAEKDKMKKIVSESIGAYVSEELPGDELYYID